jgi:predicted nucleic acid-binding protein
MTGPNGSRIAARALALNHILVRDNKQEFSRVDDLTLENWLRD